MADVQLLLLYLRATAARFRALRDDDRGSLSFEMALLAAGLAALALALVVIIGKKVIDKANGISSE